MTYSEWFGVYITVFKRGLKPKTRESYAHLHALLTPAIGEIPLEELSPEVIQMAINAIEDGNGSRQAQLAFALVRATLRRAVRSRKISWSPVDALDPPAHRARPGRAIEGADWDALRPEIDEEPALALMVYGGLRRGELLGLRRGDIDLDAGVIRVRRQRQRIGGKMQLVELKSASAVRDVPITPELAAALQRLPLMMPKAFVYPRPPEALQAHWRRIQRDCMIMQPYRLHDLRHTCATRLVAAGVQIKAVQYVLGHSSYQLTADTYSHMSARTAAAAVGRCAGFLQ